MSRKWLNMYGHIADQNRLQSVPAAFSRTGQIYGPFKSLVSEQIRQNLITFEGQAKPSKIKLVMKWWSKYISIFIAKTASRNVAFKSAKMTESICYLLFKRVKLRRQAWLPSDEEEDLELEDLGHNA